MRSLVAAGPRGVGEQALIGELWADEQPAAPHKALQVVVSRARTATCPEAIERTATGYRLALRVEEVDAWAARPEGLRLVAEGRYAEALALLELAEPDEEVVPARLRALAETVGVPAALEAYDAYRAELADHLGIDPSPALRDLHAELLRRDRPIRTGLGFDADVLIGREGDVAALQALVRGSRVVSIVGAGGLGKTRLAHLLGRTAQQPVVHFVALASVTVGDGVAVEVADAVGVQGSLTHLVGPARTADVIERLVGAIGPIPTLLILDNCEQVVDAVADLVSVLLRRTPQLTVLTTTRAPLGLSAERIYLLPELSVDDGVALFRERAEAARPGVMLPEERIAAIVVSLDGLPLAVELAAAKVRAMSVEEIERRLDNRFALLLGGARDAPERHQTLLAVIDWSWNLLAEPDRTALRRLSVFRAGFALDGAEALVGPAALERLEELVDQSLVVVDESDAGVRYRLLETVREFGRMQLVDAGDDAEALEALTGWTLGRAREAVDRLYSGDQIRAMTRVRSEEGNLVDVLRRALAADDSATVVLVFAALSSFWTIEGSHLKVINLLPAVVRLLGRGEVPDELADFERMALVAVVSNSMIFANDSLPAAVARLAALGPGEGSPLVQANVRVVVQVAGADRPRQMEALEALMDDPDRYVAMLSCFWASMAFENAGEIERSRLAAERALALVDPELGPSTAAVLTSHLAGIALQNGDWQGARARVDAALPTLRDLGAAEDVAQLRALDALVLVREDQLDDADRILDEAEVDVGAAAVFGAGLAVLCGRAEVLLARGQVEEGLSAYGAAVRDLAGREIPGIPIPAGAEPWVMLPKAAALAAFARHGRAAGAVGYRDDLLATSRGLLAAGGTFLDIPLVGCALVGVGAWEAATGDLGVGARLIALGEAFALNRILPSIDPSWGEPMIDPALLDSARSALAGLRGEKLREAASAALAELP